MACLLVTGGARSGKTTFAQKIASERGRSIAYIATAQVTDEDMSARIEKHKETRPSEWKTIERYKDFKVLEEEESFNQVDTFLLDCMTIMVTNLMFDEALDYDTCSMEAVNRVEHKIFEEVEALLDLMRRHHKQLILVTNEVGLGLVPAYRLGALFRDIAGRVNQYVANQSDEVYFIVSGLPMKIK